MTTELDLATDYAERVISGEIVAGKLVIQACRRHIADMQRDDLVWDVKASNHFIIFCLHLRLTIGEWAGKPFELSDWQCFIGGCIFGWKTTSGLRRFVTVYIEVARKNGKSSFIAAIGLYCLVAVGEAAAHIYSAATTRDQAKIVWEEAKRMVELSPALRRRVKILTNNLSITSTFSKFQPLSADASKMDGLNVFCALVDEVHEHKTAEVIQKINTAIGARREPLVIEITTAGFNRQTICYQHHEYSTKVLNGIIKNDSWFAYIATLDEGDDWTDPAVWIKANPNLGISVKPQDLKKQVDEAKDMPAQQNSIRRLRLNQWTEQSTRWIDYQLWEDNCSHEFDPSTLVGRDCYAGLDLARVNDLSALALYFPAVDETETDYVMSFFWLPEEDMITRSKRDMVPYDVWVNQGLIATTPGNATDFDFIEHEILNLAEIYNIKELAFDRTFAGEIITHLQDEGINCVQFGQGYYSMGPACAELERRLKMRRVNHNNNAVLSWNASNVAISTDPAGNMKPDKNKSSEKIDGIVALIMAVGRAMLNQGQTEYRIRVL